MHLLGISGSLRKGSFHTRLLEEARKYVELRGHSMTIHEIADIPLYNGDLDTEVKPASVLRLIDATRLADALIFAAPEYNHSISGVLKNAIDWVSRPAFKSAYVNKPCTVLTASGNSVGGARAQIAWREIMSSTLAAIYPAHDFLVPVVQNVFAADGSIQDEQVARRLERHIDGFIDWASR